MAIPNPVHTFPKGAAQAFAAGVGPLPPPIPGAVISPGIKRASNAQLKQLMATGHRQTAEAINEFNIRAGGTVPRFNPIPNPTPVPTSVSGVPGPVPTSSVVVPAAPAATPGATAMTFIVNPPTRVALPPPSRAAPPTTGLSFPSLGEILEGIGELFGPGQPFGPQPAIPGGPTVIPGLPSTIPPGAQPFAPSGPCAPGFFKNRLTGKCEFNVPVFGEEPTFGPPAAGGGRLGPSTLSGSAPAVFPSQRRECGRGSVLGDDGLCYDKRTIPNGRRMWPKPRRPLMTSGDLNAISKAARAGRRLKATDKRLRRLSKDLVTCAPRRGR